MHLSAIHLYPVKSCRGLSVTSAELDKHGLVGDRRFMVVHAADGMFITQRTHPRMALIETELTADALVLSSPQHRSISIPRQSQSANPPNKISATVWKNSVTADDCGDEPAEWFSEFLGLPLRLVRMGDAFQRPVKPSKALPGDVVAFADAYPLLVVSEASLADLNARLADLLPMNRFRPNLVIADSEPFAEDTWSRFKINHLIFRHAGLCARCPITTTNQLTAERAKEPLKTLATYRRDKTDPTDVNFGTNLIHETKSGTLHTGAKIEIL